MLRLWNKRSVNKAWEHTFQFRDHCRRTQTRLQTLHFNKQCPFSHRFGLSERRQCQVQETPYGLRLTSFVKCLAFWLRGVLFKITWQSAYTHTPHAHTHTLKRTRWYLSKQVKNTFRKLRTGILFVDGWTPASMQTLPSTEFIQVHVRNQISTASR